MTTHLGTVSELWRYPIKSMLGEQVPTVTLTNLGIDGDRRYALRDLTNNKIVSSKQPKFGNKLLHVQGRINTNNEVEIVTGEQTFQAIQTAEVNEAFSEMLGVPVSLRACHTAVAGRYVVEGHVPAADIQRLVSKTPAGVLGIAVPDMPAGSPGMEAPSRRDRYDVIAFSANGKTSVFARH